MMLFIKGHPRHLNITKWSLRNLRYTSKGHCVTSFSTVNKILWLSRHLKKKLKVKSELLLHYVKFLINLSFYFYPYFPVYKSNRFISRPCFSSLNFEIVLSSALINWVTKALASWIVNKLQRKNRIDRVTQLTTRMYVKNRDKVRYYTFRIQVF